MLYVQAALGRSLPFRPIVRILASPFQGLQRTFSNEEVFEAENEFKTLGNSNRLWIHNEPLLCKQELEPARVVVLLEKTIIIIHGIRFL